MLASENVLMANEYPLFGAAKMSSLLPFRYRNNVKHVLSQVRLLMGS